MAVQDTAVLQQYPYPSLKRTVALLTSLFSLLFSADPSLTTKNVSSVLETVRSWWAVCAVLDVPLSRRELIEMEHTSEPQRKQAAVDWWLRYSPTASWTWLAGNLYRWEERTALEAVREHIQKETAGTIVYQ